MPMGCEIKLGSNLANAPHIGGFIENTEVPVNPGDILVSGIGQVV
jgi:hypothetical protein